MNKFVLLVKNLRNAQKKYFRTRNFHDLNRAKQLEKEVDIAIQEILNPQTNLFKNESEHK